MNIEKLQIQLWNNNVPQCWYSLGEMREGALCLETVENSWIVYTAERGCCHFVKSFTSETDACRFFWKEICQMAKVASPQK